MKQTALEKTIQGVKEVKKEKEHMIEILKTLSNNLIGEEFKEIEKIIEYIKDK